MRRWTTLSLALVIFWGVSVHAQDEKDCYRPDVDMEQCLVRVLKSADADLKLSYTNAKRDLSSQDRAHLVAAQRAWIVYRHATCKAEYVLSDGDKNFRTMCLLRITTQRRAEIENLYNGGCPGPAADPGLPKIPFKMELPRLP
jgi:uncharacterized protein YecT (DUF1311 family)